MTTIILLGAQKGGCGKSTACINLAAALVNSNYSVTVLDADEQPTSSQWGSVREADQPDTNTICFVQAYGDISSAIADINTDYLLIDAAGHDSVELRSAMLLCNVLLIPFKPTLADLSTLSYMSGVISKALDHNPTMTVLGFINIAPTNVKMTDVSMAKALISEYPEIKLCDTIIHNRSAYLNGLGLGLGVTEMACKSASEHLAHKEITNLMMEVIHG